MTTSDLDALVRATPSSRDRSMDFLRAASIVSVVFGHWFISINHWDGGLIYSTSAIGVTSGLWLFTWVFQVMPIFFFVGGFSNLVAYDSAKRKGRSTWRFIHGRLERLLQPSIVFLGLWAVVQVVLHLANVGAPTGPRLWDDTTLLRGMRPPGATIPFGPLWFLGVYSVVALATFVPLIRAYWGHRHSGPLFWSLLGMPSAWMLCIALGTSAFALMTASFAQPSPTGMDPRAALEPRGLVRVTRHPLFAAFALWGIGHVVINGFLSDLIFFGGFVAFAIVGAQHQDARKRVDLGEVYAAFQARTSFVPFAAILSGRNRFAPGEMPWPALLVGAAAGVGVYLVHPWMLG